MGQIEQAAAQIASAVVRIAALEKRLHDIDHMLARAVPNLADRVSTLEEPPPGSNLSNHLALERRVAALEEFRKGFPDDDDPLVENPDGIKCGTFLPEEVDEALRLVRKAPQAFVDAYGKDPVATLAAECARLGAIIARVEILGSGPGYRMGDDTLVRLGDIRAALRGGP